ncbi:MAG: hypothetical protein LBP65_01730 [Puniceicoccales bacterium]|nr:hypothetical protein [Puniceicoccales bacterium]
MDISARENFSSNPNAAGLRSAGKAIGTVVASTAVGLVLTVVSVSLSLAVSLYAFLLIKPAASACMSIMSFFGGVESVAAAVGIAFAATIALPIMFIIFYVVPAAAMVVGVGAAIWFLVGFCCSAIHNGQDVYLYYRMQRHAGEEGKAIGIDEATFNILQKKGPSLGEIVGSTIDGIYCPWMRPSLEEELGEAVRFCHAPSNDEPWVFVGAPTPEEVNASASEEEMEIEIPTSADDAIGFEERALEESEKLRRQRESEGSTPVSYRMDESCCLIDRVAEKYGLINDKRRNLGKVVYLAIYRNHVKMSSQNIRKLMETIRNGEDAAAKKAVEEVAKMIEEQSNASTTETQGEHANGEASCEGTKILEKI